MSSDRERQKEYMRKYMRELVARRRENGLCRCCESKAIEGKTYCEYHLNHHRNRKRELYHKNREQLAEKKRMSRAADSQFEKIHLRLKSKSQLNEEYDQMIKRLKL